MLGYLYKKGGSAVLRGVIAARRKGKREKRKGQ